MISQEVYDKFLADARAEKNGTKVGVSPTDVRVNVVDEMIVSIKKKERLERSLQVQYGGKKLAVTARALKNILKLTGFSAKLFHDLPKEQLDTSMNFQLSKFKYLGIISRGDDLFSMFDNSKNPYSSYEKVLPPREKIVYIKGEPLYSDTIQIQTADHTIKNHGDLIVGMNSILSSTANAKSQFSYGVYRVRCANGWTVPAYKKHSVAVMDPIVYQGMQKAYEAEVPMFVDKLEAFVDFASKYDTSKPEQVDELLSLLAVSTKTKKTLMSCIHNPVDADDVLRAAGVDSVNNLWGMFNVLTYISSRAPNMNQSINMGRSIANWAYHITSVGLN